LLPASTVGNILVIDSKTVIAYNATSPFKEEANRYAITVDMIVKAVRIVNEVM